MPCPLEDLPIPKGVFVNTRIRERFKVQITRKVQKVEVSDTNKRRIVLL